MESAVTEWTKVDCRQGAACERLWWGSCIVTTNIVPINATAIHRDKEVKGWDAPDRGMVQRNGPSLGHSARVWANQTGLLQCQTHCYLLSQRALPLYVDHYSFRIPLRVGGWVGLSGWLVSEGQGDHSFSTMIFHENEFPWPIGRAYFFEINDTRFTNAYQNKNIFPVARQSVSN